ncbi:CLUMA_CG005542, isoform A [Clunio marinus]|uniref:CLUMA_CG005542, isoform A n=1 Tax=Clunio marinus TaxID=568069 RepID=A0A1J1HWK8_9DIPT|nr:CLUMA_CG005542, isoform A [Clunio marinus]
MKHYIKFFALPFRLAYNYKLHNRPHLSLSFRVIIFENLKKATRRSAQLFNVKIKVRMSEIIFWYHKQSISCDALHQVANAEDL